MMLIDQDWISDQRRIGDALGQAASKARHLRRTDLLEEIDRMALCTQRKDVVERLSYLAQKLEHFRKNVSDTA